MGVKQAVGLQVKGIKELTEQLRSLQNASASKEVAHMLGGEGKGFLNVAEATAHARNWPKECFEEQWFVDAGWPKSRRGKKQIVVLFGIRKRNADSYVEWGNAVRKYKVSPPKLIGMSLATLFEFGGEHRPPSHRPERRIWLPARPAFRPALQQYKPTAKANVKTGTAEILNRALGTKHEAD